MKLLQFPNLPYIYLSLLDIVLIILIILCLYIYGNVKSNNIKSKKTVYRYYNIGLMSSVFISIIYSFTVIIFYPGDSFGYFSTTRALSNLMFSDFKHFADIMFIGNKSEFFHYFSYETGYPFKYMWRDNAAMFVGKFYLPFMFFASDSYFICNIIAGLIGFSGIWKLFVMFSEKYPNLEKQFLFGIVLFPSTIYWSGGMMKDTIIIAALGWIIYAFNRFFIEKKFNLKYIIIIIFWSYATISVKPYVFVAILAALLVWFFAKKINVANMSFSKILLFPVFIVMAIFLFVMIISNLKSKLGVYGDIDTTLEYAQVMQSDLSRSSQYGENYYKIDAATNIGSAAKVAPLAIVTALYRPFLWEAKNPFILLAALEGSFLMILSIYSVFAVGPLRMIKFIFKDPLLLAAFTFIIIFGFGVGLASTNFGALVRYKMPMLPFFVPSLLILLDYARKYKQQAKVKQKIIIENTDLKSSNYNKI